MVKKTVYDWHRQDTRMTELKDVCTTAAAGWGGGGNNMPYVLEPKQTTKEEYTECWEDGLYREYDCNQCPYRLDCHRGEEDDPHAIVRRLTPLEAERLQGYPDGWTDIGEWTDSKGKKHKDVDSPRYKALGNSIALPFWEWMAKRMVIHMGHEPTMASLFDGIGGFPLVFSRAGVTPVWASEIEEFPIAVTKIRFPDKEAHMRKPLYNDPTRYGRIPDPPERSECCGNCWYNHREGKDLFLCSNEDCENYASYMGYDDWCDYYEVKEDE